MPRSSSLRPSFSRVHPFEISLIPQFTPAVPRPLPKPRGRREQRQSGLQVTLHARKNFGFTHPNAGDWLMAPLECEALLALETQAVAQVRGEGMRQTIGRTDERTGGRREWGQRRSRPFARYGIMARGAARRGLER